MVEITKIRELSFTFIEKNKNKFFVSIRYHKLYMYIFENALLPFFSLILYYFKIDYENWVTAIDKKAPLKTFLVTPHL